MPIKVIFEIQFSEVLKYYKMSESANHGDDEQLSTLSEPFSFSIFETIMPESHTKPIEESERIMPESHPKPIEKEFLSFLTTRIQQFFDDDLEQQLFLSRNKSTPEGVPNVIVDFAKKINKKICCLDMNLLKPTESSKIVLADFEERYPFFRGESGSIYITKDIKGKIKGRGRPSVWKHATKPEQQYFSKFAKEADRAQHTNDRTTDRTIGAGAGAGAGARGGAAGDRTSGTSAKKRKVPANRYSASSNDSHSDSDNSPDEDSSCKDTVARKGVTKLRGDVTIIQDILNIERGDLAYTCDPLETGITPVPGDVLVCYNTKRGGRWSYYGTMPGTEIIDVKAYSWSAVNTTHIPEDGFAACHFGSVPIRLSVEEEAQVLKMIEDGKVANARPFIYFGLRPGLPQGYLCLVPKEEALFILTNSHLVHNGKPYYQKKGGSEMLDTPYGRRGFGAIAENPEQIRRVCAMLSPPPASQHQLERATTTTTTAVSLVIVLAVLMYLFRSKLLTANNTLSASLPGHHIPEIDASMSIAYLARENDNRVVMESAQHMTPKVVSDLSWESNLIVLDRLLRRARNDTSSIDLKMAFIRTVGWVRESAHYWVPYECTFKGKVIRSPYILYQENVTTLRESNNFESREHHATWQYRVALYQVHVMSTRTIRDTCPDVFSKLFGFKPSTGFDWTTTCYNPYVGEAPSALRFGTEIEINSMWNVLDSFKRCLFEVKMEQLNRAIVVVDDALAYVRTHGKEALPLADTGRYRMSADLIRAVLQPGEF